MFIKNLKIENRSGIIRDIPFQKGINLIIDETRTKNKKESGNNVGKTTVLRLINFCLGGEGKNIYIDPEFKTSNILIEDFLKKENVIVSLTLTRDLENKTSDQITIRKNFLSRKNKIQEINGEYFNDNDFDSKLKELVFKTKQHKPTFKQIVAKNLRDEKNRLVNTIKVLSPYTTKEEYEALFLFWLGIEVPDISQKQILQEKNKTELRLQRRLSKEGALSQINQSLVIVNRSIKALEEKKRTFNKNENYIKDINYLNETRTSINEMSTEIGVLETRKNLIKESEDELRSDFVNINSTQIKNIYEKAKLFMPKMQKTFEEVLNFHTEMLKEKIEFITQELPSIERDIANSKGRLNKLLVEEKNITSRLHKDDATIEMEKIIIELNNLHEKRGELNEAKRLWDKSNKQLKKIEEDLEVINKKIASKDNLINQRVEEFNKYFSDLSYKLYGEKFYMSPDKVKDVYQLSISSIEGNLGTGKKKGQIAAFDFAYIQFADAIGVNCIHFILHDQIENIHHNQIDSIVTDIVGNTNCQYIVPVLRDKLPKDINISQFEILKLSQSDKLFKI